MKAFVAFCLVIVAVVGCEKNYFKMLKFVNKLFFSTAPQRFGGFFQGPPPPNQGQSPPNQGPPQVNISAIVSQLQSSGVIPSQLNVTAILTQLQSSGVLNPPLNVTAILSQLQNSGVTLSQFNVPAILSQLQSSGVIPSQIAGRAPPSGRGPPPPPRFF